MLHHRLQKYENYSFQALLLAQFVALSGAIFVTGCEPAHVAAYTPKRRALPEFAAPPPNPEGSKSGSLWQSSAPSLYSDMRAFRENDIVIVRITEKAAAQRSADTDLQHNVEGSTSWNVPILGAILGAAGAAIPVDGSLEGQNSARSLHEGTTGRTESLDATVSAVVRKVLPNGNLFIEGHRVVLVNAEEQHLYVSGIVRPIDIEQDNSVQSSAIADAEIEFVGRGVMSDNQKQGWLHQGLSWIWPF